jgi:Zn-dependent M16 (insulinase) family peptidase
MDYYGFELLREQNIAELKTRARLFRHAQTSAQLLSLENDDENKTFGITLRTPPADSTGVAHILEHSVLNGSRKYPVKEPFTQMVKGSLRTFLNALTFPDKTVYPVASQHLQDFYNLVDVYFDAVFHPRILRETFEQEGWHYELTEPSAALTYKGVVFNEMKGAYSAPDGALHRFSRQTLFPHTLYRFDSGGDPSHIPDLSYEQFVSFHQTYYHPSNSFIVFCGDDDPAERLRRTHEVLKEFDGRPGDAVIGLQQRFAEPRRFRFSYAGGANAASQTRAMATVNWMLDEYTDAASLMALDILSYLLMGTQASPLRKALLDSRLGEEVTGGLDSGLRQMTFAAGLKGIDAADADRVEALILKTLELVAHEGFAPELVEAAFNTVEFRLRENNTGSFPRGLSLMFHAISVWVHGHDPLALIAFEAPLQVVKHQAAAGELFQALIRHHLLANSHRTMVVLEPDAALHARDEAAEQERLLKVREALSESDVQALVENTHRLKLLQETPDSAEALATLPLLKVSDLDKTSKTIPSQTVAVPAGQLLFHDLFTNGIAYVDVGFDMRSLPAELLPYVPLFSRALLELGTDAEDYVKLSVRIGRKTGGVSRASLLTLRQDDGARAGWLFLCGKSSMAQTGDLLAILRDVLTTVKLDNRDRFRQLVLQEKARQEAGLVPAGHAYAAMRMRSYLNVSDWAQEQMGGISYLFFLRDLAAAIENDWPAVRAALSAIKAALVNSRMLACNVTLDAANWAQLEPHVVDLLGALPAAPLTHKAWPSPPAPVAEGLTLPSKMNYVVKGDDLYRHGFNATGAALVATRMLSTGYLHDRVRVQGGAYGAGCSFDRNTGVFSFTSYRDPGLQGTLDVYDGAAEFLRHGEIDEADVQKNIIGLIGQLDFYQLPDAKGYTSLVRCLTGITEEKRQQLRDEILGTTLAGVRAFADAMEAVKENGTVVVLGSADAIAQANTTRADWLRVTRVM